MKKMQYIVATLGLASVFLLSGCGQSTSSSSSSSSESAQEQTVNSLVEIKNDLEEDSYNQAKEKLDEALKKDPDNKDLKAAKEQVDLYMKAKEAYREGRYDVALDNAKKVCKVESGLELMDSKAKDLETKAKDELAEKQQKSKEKKVQKREQAATKAANVSNSKWNGTKQAELGNLMTQWSASMGQDYSKVGFSEYVGNMGCSVSDFQNGSATLYVSGQPVTVTLGNQEAGSSYHIVGAYDGMTNNGDDTTYLFAIHNGQGVVLVSQNSDYIESNTVDSYFTPTKNQNLSSRFANLVG